MATIISGSKSALDVYLNGTIGTFNVSKEDGSSSGVEVRYLLTHVTLSDMAEQEKFVGMLAPVREVFDLKQLDFDEIMQRDIEDSRVSLELIPYLLDTSTTGLIKLFPPIVAVALPLQPKSRVPAAKYRKVTKTELPFDDDDHPGVTERLITAGELGHEQFQFRQLFKDGVPIPEGAQLQLAKEKCTLAIVDGQHRAMALLALHRNLTNGWSDSTRQPYEGYYKVWPDKEIRTYDLTKLQLPVLICTFPQLDEGCEQDIDVIRAARRVFLTLNKTAKSVSDSRNKLLNDQDVVAECLRATLSHIKNLDAKDDTGLRIWNVELDQERDRAKIASDVAFIGVSHLYHIADHLLMGTHAHGIEAKGKAGAPKKKLDLAYERLGLKDTLTKDQCDANNKFNYSDDIKNEFREKWSARYTPIIDRLYAKVHPFAAHARATLALNQEIVSKRDSELEKMLFDGQATIRTFDAFRDGLSRRVADKEPNWDTPEIKQTLERVQGVMTSRRRMVETMKATRALFVLEGLSGSIKKKAMPDGVVIAPLREAVDSLFENVFSTIAFQTAVVCTYAEAIERAYGNISGAPQNSLEEYISALNAFLRPTNSTSLKSLMQAFEGEVKEEDEKLKMIAGGPTFRQVVLPGELQPAEWPKYRYMIIELWKPSDDSLKSVIEQDRDACRNSVAQLLVRRKISEFCREHRVLETDLEASKKSEIISLAKSNFEEFLGCLHGGRKVHLRSEIFNLTAANQGPTDDEINMSDDAE